MTFENILELLNDTTKTRYQLAADIHALIEKATKPSALNISPVKTRAKRGPNKAKVPPLMQGAEPGPSVALMNGHDDHAEAN